MPIHEDIQSYNASLPRGERIICDTLRRAIDLHLHGAECRIWHRHPVWFLEGNPIVGYSKLKDCIRLLFWSGQSFNVPGLKPEGSFKAAEKRYTSADQIVPAELERWLTRAAVVQWDYKNIVKRRGKLVRLKPATRRAEMKPARPRTGTASLRRSKSPGTPTPAAPRLLSGGNPQIAKGDGDAPVLAYINAMPGWKRDVGRRLDAIITRAVPGVRKAVKWNSPFYGSRDADNGWFLSMHCFTSYVKVAFFHGATLRPVPPGRSKQKDVRYLDIREHDTFDVRQFTDWVKQAARLPGCSL